MTRRHFQLIADTLKYCDRHCDNADETALVAWVSDKFADALANENPRFDRAKFLKACGVEA